MKRKKKNSRKHLPIHGFRGTKRRIHRFKSLPFWTQALWGWDPEFWWWGTGWLLSLSLRGSDEIGVGHNGKIVNRDQLLPLQWFVAAVIKIHCWGKLLLLERNRRSVDHLCLKKSNWSLAEWGLDYGLQVFSLIFTRKSTEGWLWAETVA